jgi:hypothetical protein
VAIVFFLGVSKGKGARYWFKRCPALGRDFKSPKASEPPTSTSYLQVEGILKIILLTNKEVLAHKNSQEKGKSNVFKHVRKGHGVNLQKGKTIMEASDN